MKRIVNDQIRSGLSLYLSMQALWFCMLFTAITDFLHAQSSEISLSQNWSFRKAGDSSWLAATVPGNVHTDLMAHGIIQDPFRSDNEELVQWVENEDWEYQTSFNADAVILDNEQVELVFKGLDTRCAVYLNGELILQANNMFRTWTVDVKDLLLKENNKLLIRFHSSVKEGLALADAYPYPLPGDKDGRVFIRKPAYQYGWDWGPRLVTCGIWQSVILRGWSRFLVENISVTTQSLDSVAAVIKVSVLYRGNVNPMVIDSIALGTGADSFRCFKTMSDSGLLVACFRKQQPNLWQPNGSGNSFLYRLPVTLYGHEDGRGKTRPILLRTDTISFGIRTIELVHEDDAIGKSFYFRVNGNPLFMKGANIIPPDNFLPRIPEQTYRQLVDDAAAAHMNMLRVWGGGAYLPDAFYQYCDERGILVWQDFMFANAMHPGDSSFLENVRAEATEQVIRLRSHPCLALWCGNNEIDEAWKNWGYQVKNKLKPDVNTKIWNDYLQLFDTLLPQVVSTNHQETAYRPSSPLHGWGHKEAYLEGDSHYWGVWWARAPFTAYETHVGRFMSEYGFQSMPLSNWDAFTTAEDRKTVPVDKRAASDVLNVHQKHPYGYENIYGYMSKHYRVPDDFLHYAYVSQLVQRDGMSTAIEAHRRAMPACMGTLYWQLNDCWPVTSWSSMDYTGEWKAFHYELSRLYAPLLVSVTVEEDSLSIHLISDYQNHVTGVLRATLIPFDGAAPRILFNELVTAKAGHSAPMMNISDHHLPHGREKRSTLLKVEFIASGRTEAYRHFFFTDLKRLALDDPRITFTILPGEMKSSHLTHPFSYQIELKATAFAKDVYLYAEGGGVKFSENFFDLLPGEAKTVVIYSKQPLDANHLVLKVNSLYDAK